MWVAWLNLENLYGAPSPDEAVMALFQRALQHCDQKRLYAALLAILQRTGKVGAGLSVLWRRSFYPWLNSRSTISPLASSPHMRCCAFERRFETRASQSMTCMHADRVCFR